MQRISNDLFEAIRAVTHPVLAEAKLDPVGKEDADVNNDGNTDKSDDYLKNRRKAISASVKKEEVEQADEATALQKMGNPRFAQNLPTMGHAGSVTMKHVNASSATPQVKAAIKKAAPDIKTYGDRAAALNAAGIKREEVEQQDDKIAKPNKKGSESDKDFLARQERLAAAAAQTAKDPARLKRMMNIPGYSAAMGLAKDTITKEEVEELDELSKTTLGSYAKKATRDAVITRKIGADFEHQGRRAKSPGMKAASDMLSQRYKAKSFKRRAGVDKAVDRLTKEEVEQFDEGVSETIVKHNDFTIEITDNPTFGDFLRAVQSIVRTDEEAAQAELISIAEQAFKENDDEVIIESFTRMEIEDKINAHRKAGNRVSDDKYSTKSGQPYAEYVVTDSEGGRKKYIHHGSVRRLESLPPAKKAK